MPTVEHEGLVTLFRDSPLLAAELLRDSLGFALPAGARAYVSSETVRDVSPVEIRAEAVVVFERRGKPVLAVIVEIQRHPDRDKRRRARGRAHRHPSGSRARAVAIARR
jgi:hypothetical protein